MVGMERYYFIDMGKFALLKLFFIFVVFIGMNGKAWAHPVAYRGSKGLMGYHSPLLTHSQLNYSFRHWIAAGVHHIRRHEIPNRTATFASANFLIHRWNGSGLQANIYGVVGAGVSHLEGEEQSAGLALLQFDIEDRDYYFLAKHSQIVGEQRKDMDQSIVRLGFSPYVEGFEGFHSWIIFEWQNSNFYDGTHITDLTPFLRFFYRNLLFEVGQSFEGVTRFNYIVHF